MKNTWRHYLRRFAAVSAVGGTMAWSSAMCYAVQLAYDDASDPVYATAWDEGDDGGTGLGPWNFDGTYNTLDPGQQAMDDGLKSDTQTSSTFNDVGRAWTMYNPLGRPVLPANGASGTDIARAGRALDSPLQIGQTVSIVFDNPTERFFFRGYTLKFNTATANECHNGDNCTTMAYDPGAVATAWQLQMFDYFTYGNWQWTTYNDMDPDTENYPLFDTDTGNGGGRLDVTLTGPTTLDWTLTPLAHPELATTRSDTLDDTDPILWIEFQHWNTDSDYYPTKVAMDARATDFYIRSIEVTSPDSPGLPGDFNKDGKVDVADFVMWQKDNSVGTYDVWKTNFGSSLPGAGGGGAVPEPGTFALLVAGGGLLFASWQHRRRPPKRLAVHISHSAVDVEDFWE
jgi:hypothetical protein